MCFWAATSLQQLWRGVSVTLNVNHKIICITEKNQTTGTRQGRTYMIVLFLWKAQPGKKYIAIPIHSSIYSYICAKLLPYWCSQCSPNWFHSVQIHWVWDSLQIHLSSKESLSPTKVEVLFVRDYAGLWHRKWDVIPWKVYLQMTGR